MQTAYREAVEAETKGSLDEALQLYRRAFRLDSNVNRIYERSLLQSNALRRTSISHSVTLPSVVPLSASLGSPELSEKPIPSKPPNQVGGGPSISIDTIVSEFLAQPLKFEPEIQTVKAPIQNLPPELLVYILRMLGKGCDYGSIEAFASVNRKARVVSLESSIWRCVILSISLLP
jgi:F-box protein 9